MNKKTKSAIAALLLAGSASAMAQVGPIRPQYEFPGTPPDAAVGAIAIGSSGFYFAPFITLAYGRDDNLFLTNGNETKSNVIFVSPGFSITGRDPNKVFELSYQGNFGQYEDSRADDYVDHAFNASFDMQATRQLALRAAFDYDRGHDPRGSTDRGIGVAPDEYTLATPSIIVAFGQPGARGRFELYASDARKRYENNRATTFGSDRDTREYGIAGYFRVMPRTSVLVEYRNTDVDYTFIGSPLSGEEERVFAGVTWEASAAMSGTVKVGELRKRFNCCQPSFSGTIWEGLVTWMPRTYSKFDLYAYRQPVESSGLGSFILSDAVGINWNHAWNSKLSTEMNGRVQKDKYQNFVRSDDVYFVGAKVAYKFRRWLSLGAELQHTTRESNLPAFDYDKNLWLVTLTASM